MTEVYRRLPVGIQSFEKIRKNNFVYVDKTITEEKLEKLISDGMFPISDFNINEDLECIIDDKISELIWWGKSDNMWAVREKDSINDEYSENYLDLK